MKVKKKKEVLWSTSSAEFSIICFIVFMLGFLVKLFFFLSFFFFFLLREKKKTADPEECTFSARTA